MIFFNHFGRIWFISLKYIEFKKFNRALNLFLNHFSMKSHFVCVCVCAPCYAFQISLKLSFIQGLFSPRNTDFATLLYFLQL